MTRSAAAVLTMLFAAAMAPLRATAGAPSAATGPRAEVQIALCAPPDRIVQALHLHPAGAPIEVWQFDDAALALFGRGVRLRLRVSADGRSELTLKVADQDCARLDRGLVPAGEGKCEYDVYGERQAGAVSLNVSLGVARTKDLVAGRLPPEQALSPAQARYLRDVVGVWPLPAGIRALGPMQVRTFRTTDKHYDIDVSQLPGGERYAEISRKVPLSDATRTMDRMQADLARAGVATCADQSSQAVNKLRALLH
jgi:hypothetical protein